MDENAVDLVVQLCTRIGMVMEDAGPEAITIAGMDHDCRRAAIQGLDTSIAEMRALIDAAMALWR
jgi:hypothetical protein